MEDISGNDVNKMRVMNASLHEIALCDDVMTFYYDETGNCGKFILREDGVNSPSALNDDFILGGVAFSGNKCPVNPEELISKLKIQADELKFKNIYVKKNNFLEFMGTNRVSIYVDWLYNSGLYIHYATINNLYYGLVDMVDSLWQVQPQFCFSMEWGLLLKSSLYNFCKEHLEDTLNLFYRYNYPNIEREKVDDFCFDFCSLIRSYNNEGTERGFYVEAFRQMFKYAAKKGELTFLHDNENNILVDGYWSLYQGRCENYKNAIHHFDYEKVILKKLEDFPLIENNIPFVNYDFVDSKQNKMIQICDVFVGLMSKLFKFLDETPLDLIKTLKKESNSNTLENMQKIHDLIIRSENFHKMMIQNISDVDLVQQRFLKLQFFASVINYEDLQNYLR